MVDAAPAQPVDAPLPRRGGRDRPSPARRRGSRPLRPATGAVPGSSARADPDVEYPRPRSQRALPTVTTRPSTRPSMPLPGSSTTPLGVESSKPCATRVADERLGHHVRGELVQGRGQAQHLVVARPRRRRPRARPRARRAVTVPVLSSSTVRAAPSCSMAPPPLTRTPPPRGPRDARDERDRGRQDQRARRGDDEHGQGANRVAAEQPGDRPRRAG